MAGPALSFRLTVDATGLNAGLQAVSERLRGIGAQVKQAFAGGAGGNPLGQMTGQVGGLNTMMGGLVTKLGALVTVYAAFGAIRGMAMLSDQTALATARIEGLTGSMRDTRVAQEALFELSQRLQASYGEATASFARMLPAVQELGGGVAETTQLTEILMTTAKLSGASAAEAGASAIQFAQALGSGKLQGDELRSILENNNMLARALAAGLGVTIGELRRMGEEGKLTSDLVANTLMGAYDDIKAKASDLPSTVGGAWTQIRNAFTLLVQSISNGTGVFGGLAMVMTEVARVIEVVARTLFAAGDSSDSLADRKGAQEFAQAVGKAFAWMADVVTAVIRGVVDIVGGLVAVFRAAGNQLGAVAAAIAAAMRGDFAGAGQILRDAGEVGASAVNRLGAAIGESAARMMQAWTGAGAAYTGYVAALEAGAAKGAAAGTSALTGGGGGGDDAKAGRVASQQMQSEMDAIDASIKAERKRFESAQEAAKIRSEMDRDRALAAIASEEMVARHQLDTQQMTQAQYLEALAKFEDQKYGIRRATLAGELEIARASGRDPEEVERINQQLLALELDYQQRKAQIALDVEQASGSRVLGSAWDAMKSSMGSALDGMLTRAKTFGQAMAGIWGSMRAAIVNEVGRILMAKVAAYAKEKLLALAGISMSAAKAGAGAAESQASIPIVGPALAMAAMGAIVASVMGLAGGMKSAAGGYDIPAGLNPVTQLHAEEMVLPAEHANTIRDLGRQAPREAPIELRGVSAGEFFIAVRKDLVAALKNAHREFAF